MFKLHRHRSERLGERVDLRFSSFQAFQIPTGWDRLVLSLFSVETGKTIAKANKATVRSGTCQWTETFSESIWIPHDNASKEIEECVLKIVVSMGSHRSGILGDLTINLMDYLSSRDSGSLSLRLKNCNYGTLLQVRIQCLNPKRGFREVKSSRESYLEGRHTTNDDVDSQSDGSDNMFNQSLGSLSSNHPDVLVNRDTSFLAPGSHRSSDSGDSAAGRLNFSPRNNLNGGSYMGRQDSAGSHISAASSAGPTDDFSRSNPSSFNSRASGTSTPIRWQESMMQTSGPGLAPISLRQSGSSKDFLEVAEETIEELQDEAKMWERHAQKLKLDVEKFRKECSDKTKHQAELDLELSAAYSERDTLKQEVGQLKASLEEATRKQTATRASRNEVILRVQKELEDEVKYLKESNANLNLQLNKSQEANLELVSILEELEDTVEKQRLELANLPQQSPLTESKGDLWSQKLLDVEAEWEAKLSVKEKEIRKLEEKLSGKFNVEYSSENESSRGYSDLIEEIVELRGKLQELERDCAELTDENLELIYKMNQSGNDIKVEKDSENSVSEIDFLKSQIRRLEEEIRTNEMLNGGQAETSAIQIKNLEKKCADLEVELQHFKDQACDLDGKLRDSQLEVQGKISELTELQQKLKSFDTVTALNETEEQERTNKENVGKDSDIEDVKFAFSLKEKEIDVQIHAKEELEVLVTNIQRDKIQLEESLAGALRESTITSKCLEDVQHEMALLASSVDSHSSTNKMLERKLMELESHKYDLEVHVSKLEEENVQLSERISSLEAQLRYLTYEESNRLELEDSRSLVEDLKGEFAKQQAEIETHKGELEQKLLDAQKRLSETQEETDYLKRSYSKLHSTVESLNEENSLLQKSNGDLRRQKLDLYEHGARLEVELSESQKRTSEFLKKVEFLEAKFSSMQTDIVFKEEMLTSQLENIFQEHKDQEEKISQAKLMLNQIDVENTVEVEDLKRENVHLSSQLCSTHDEQQRMASDAVLEVSGLRADKVKLENSLQGAFAKIKLYETELQSLKQESSKKVQGLADLLNASKQSEEMLMSDIKQMQMQAEAAKSGEEKFRKLANELERKLEASDYEKQQIIEETSSLKFQVQKIVHFQDDILVLKSSLEEVKFEKGKLEESLQSVSEECEGLKTERISFMEKISKMQKALHDGEDERCSRIGLEEKLIRLEGDLSSKEASYAHEAELKNEINCIERANSEYQRKIQCLEEEKCELKRDAQVLRNEENQDKIGLGKCGVEKPSREQHEKQSTIEDASQLVDADQTKGMDESKLRDLESTIWDLEAKIRSLESELAESVAANNMYKVQLQGLMAEKQSSNSEVTTVSMSVEDIQSQQCKMFSLEAELTDVQHANKVAALEAELKDMRERYLHMSLQYAEVEAQREELVLKLKTTAKGKGWFS